MIPILRQENQRRKKTDGARRLSRLLGSVNLMILSEPGLRSDVVG